MLSIFRYTVIIGISLTTVLSALAQSSDPTVRTMAAGEELQRGEVQPDITTHFLAGDGRAMGVLNGGASVGLTNALSVGATVQGTSGHGRTETRRYDAVGGRVWGAWQLAHVDAKHPGLALQIEKTEERIRLHSVEPGSSFTADPAFASSGVQLRTTFTRRGIQFAAHAGMGRAAVNHDEVATVASLGGEMRIPVNNRYYLQSALIGYRDNYEGRHVSYEARLGLHTTPAHRIGLNIEASLFPRGIPLAGTPLSAASAVGVIYGSSATAQLHTQMVGYLSVSGEYQF
jgi:hypothetical protein